MLGGVTLVGGATFSTSAALSAVETPPEVLYAFAVNTCRPFVNVEVSKRHVSHGAPYGLDFSEWRRVPSTRKSTWSTDPVAVACQRIDPETVDPSTIDCCTVDASVTAVVGALVAIAEPAVFEAVTATRIVMPVSSVIGE
jgi:hypothetical protein